MIGMGFTAFYPYYGTFPDGFANPEQTPLYPQTQAEIMVGRIPLSETQMRMPNSLQECVISEQTAREINWLKN